MPHRRPPFYRDVEEDKNEAKFHHPELKDKFVGQNCCCCNADVSATDSIVEFRKCEHIFHEECLADQESFPYSPRCWVCSGRLVKNNATGSYEYTLIWSENWENLYGELRVWMKDHLGDRVGSVQLHLSESFRAFQCRMVGHATFKAFVINPFKEEMQALTRLLHYESYEILGCAVDMLYNLTVHAANKKVVDVSSMSQIVNQTLVELDRTHLAMELCKKELEEAVRSAAAPAA